jgi:hypothetical protein
MVIHFIAEILKRFVAIARNKGFPVHWGSIAWGRPHYLIFQKVLLLSPITNAPHYKVLRAIVPNISAFVKCFCKFYYNFYYEFIIVCKIVSNRQRIYSNENKKDKLLSSISPFLEQNA